MHPDSVPQSTNEQQQTTTAQPMPASDEQTMTRPPPRASATPATAREKLEEWVTGDGYDAVLGIGLFTDVYDNNRGWRVALSSTKGTALANATAIRVAPIGVFNVGKTWLIKKICGESIGLSSASALDKHTESLSIKMGKLSADHNVVFLDTAGLNSPVTSVTSLGRLLGTTKMDPMKAMEGMLQELTRQANFVREVAFEFGQVFLMVLGQISHHDQQELLQLVQLAERHGSKKHVVVVHNLKKLSYAEFMTPDPTTGKTYVEMMSSIFALTPSEHKMGLNDKTFIRELHGVFGSEKSAVHMRHLFMTRDDANDADCRNEWVVKRIRDLIDQGTPTMGNVLVDIARIASNCAKKMVHLPPGNAAEIRYHSQRSVFLGGLVTDDERLRLEKERKEPPKDPRVDALEVQLAALQAELANGNADEATQAALREQMHEADTALSNARVEMARRNKLTVVDASTLVPLTVAVEAAPIALGGGGGSSSSRSTVKFNVTRSKVVSASGPCWAVHVHMTVAGLMAGEVARLRSVLQWESGCYLEAPTPQHPETLKISFRARVAPMAAKQMASLNQHGRVCGNSLGGVIAVNPNSLPVVVEAGNRPFPTTEAAVGAAREGLHDDGTYDLDVAVHTRVDSVMYDYEPRVTYACGVLTVTVLAEPSDTDRTDPANANWLESAELQLLPEVNGKDALAFDENDLTE